MNVETSENHEVAVFAGPVAALSFIAGVAGAAVLSDVAYPRPGSSAVQISRYFGDNAGPARISIAGQLISAAALGVFGSAVVGLARRAQPQGRALATSAIAGSVLSVASQTASALTALHLTRGTVARSDAADRLHKRVFLTGGPLHGPGIGLLMGSLGMAGLRTGALPRWLSVAALGTAAAGLLAPLALKVDRAVWLIPASRFPGLLLSAGAGLALSRR